MNQLIVLLILISAWPLAIVVIGESAYRIFKMPPDTSKLGWAVQYGAYALYALSIALWLTHHAPVPDSLEIPLLLLLGLFGVALNLWLTHHHWRRELLPPVTQLVEVVERSTDVEQVRP